MWYLRLHAILSLPASDVTGGAVKSSPHHLHLIAPSCISSAQNGHLFILTPYSHLIFRYHKIKTCYDPTCPIVVLFSIVSKPQTTSLLSIFPQSRTVHKKKTSITDEYRRTFS